MRTSAQKINTAAKKTVVGVVVVLTISLGLDTIKRELELKDRDEISKEDAIEIAKKKYSSIINAGGIIEVAKIKQYKPIKLGVKNVLNRLRMH